jgi:lipid-A-disaccharide synthase
LDCRIFTARAKEVMAAADLVICASGTTTLEVMLINRPMVVCYRLTPFTYRVLKWFRMVKTQYFALPNILASESLVPELIQHEVSGQNIAREASAWLNQPERCNELRTRFEKLHAKLRIGAAATAARVVLQHIEDSK